MLDLEEKFTQAGLYFELYHHHPIYTNEDALVVKKEHGFSGTETKSLYLKDKKGDHYVYLTFTTKQTDFKILNQLTGKRLSVVPSKEMEEETGQKKGAVSPFGYEVTIPILIDRALLEEEKLVFAPGRPDQTMVVKTADLEKILRLLAVPVFLVST